MHFFNAGTSSNLANNMKNKTEKSPQAGNLELEWEEWLNQNLNNNCDPKGLYDIMLKNGFSDQSIIKMMGEAQIGKVVVKESEPKNSINVDHQKLSTTPLGANDPNLKVNRFNTTKLQLFTIEDFMTRDECEHLIHISAEHLRPSTLTHSNGDDKFRTSSTCDFTKIDDSFIDEIDRRISRTLGIRLSYSETIQVQRYEVGEEFKTHHDFFSPNTSIYKDFAEEQGNRTWTFAVYLNTTMRGGGTRFTEIDHTFYPKQGMATIWNNLAPDGTPNPMTVHHGMIVEEGFKVIITKWFREYGEGEVFYV